MSLLIYDSPPPFVEGDDSEHTTDRELLVALVDSHDEKLAAAGHARRLTPNEKKRARGAMSRYVLNAIQTAATKHYSQHRPMAHLGRSPLVEWTADCSGFDTGVFAWARKVTGLPVEDPNGASFNFSGWGYTGTLLAANYRRQVPSGRRYFIGDMALYGAPGATKHTVICFKGGDRNTSVWGSHGNEAGPYAVRLHYRADFLCVVRGWSLQ